MKSSSEANGSSEPRPDPSDSSGKKFRRWLRAHLALVVPVALLAAIVLTTLLVKPTNKAASLSLSAKAETSVHPGTRLAGDNYCYIGGVAFSAGAKNSHGQTCVRPTGAHWSGLTDAYIGGASAQGTTGGKFGGMPASGARIASLADIKGSAEMSLKLGLATTVDVVSEHPAIAIIIFLLGVAVADAADYVDSARRSAFGKAAKRVVGQQHQGNPR